MENVGFLPVLRPVTERSSNLNDIDTRNKNHVRSLVTHGPGRFGPPQHKQMGSDGSLLGSSFGIGLQSLSYHNELATLNINDFKSA